jgi:hypothetical protein
MRQLDIVGLSLAEMSLALLFVVLALQRPAPNPSASQLAAATKQIGTLHLKLDTANRKIANLNEEIYQLQNRINTFTPSRPNLRSVALPSCAETKVRADWLFTAIIRGQNRYDIGHSGSLSIEDIVERFHAEMEDGRIHGCVQRVQVYVGSNVSAQDYDFALRRLERYFYPKKLGAEPQ